MGLLLSALRKVSGFENAIDAVIKDIADVMQEAAEGHDPTLDNEAMAEIQRALLKWNGRRQVDLARYKRLLDEKYSGEDSDQ